MKCLRAVSALLLLMLFLIVTIVPAMAQESPPMFGEPVRATLGPPIQETRTDSMVVRGADGQQSITVPVTTVSLTQNANIKVLKPNGIQPSAVWTAEWQNVTFTMQRQLSGYQGIGGMRVSASGYSQTSATANEIRVGGTHYYGSNSSCGARGPNYGVAYAYNTTYVSASEGPNLYAPNQWHCIKLGHHSARFGSSWPFWYDGQTGPSGVW